MASTSCFLHHLLPSTAATKVQSPRATVRPSQLVCRAQKQQSSGTDEEAVSRRLALTALVGVAAVGSKVSPAEAAYGEAANVFGKAKTNTDFQPFNGNGFKLSIPSKWNQSKEVEFKGQVVRFEDNFDTTTNVAVLVLPTNNKTISDYGSPEEFLRQFNYLLGKQAFAGKTSSEGGFEPNEVAAANLLEQSSPVVDGNSYYNLSVLTRTADGDEGGKHHLITATVKGGNLYLCKAQAGDKRWFKGARRYVEGAASSFSVA